MGFLDVFAETIGTVFRPGGIASQVATVAAEFGSLKREREQQREQIRLSQAQRRSLVAIPPGTTPGAMTRTADQGGQLVVVPQTGVPGELQLPPNTVARARRANGFDPNRLLQFLGVQPFVGPMEGGAVATNGMTMVPATRVARIHIQSTHHSTPTGQRRPNKVSLIQDPVSGESAFFVHAGQPTAWSKVTIKKPRRCHGHHHHHPN